RHVVEELQFVQSHRIHFSNFRSIGEARRATPCRHFERGQRHSNGRVEQDVVSHFMQEQCDRVCGQLPPSQGDRGRARTDIRCLAKAPVTEPIAPVPKFEAAQPIPTRVHRHTSYAMTKSVAKRDPRSGSRSSKVTTNLLTSLFCEDMTATV